MKIALLISQKDDQVILQDDYKIGWLYWDDKQGYWSSWGSCKDLKSALKVAKEVINEKGEKEVYLSNERLRDGRLSLDKISNFENITKSVK